MSYEEIPMYCGNKKATSTIVQFQSIKCPHCKTQIIPKGICIDGDDCGGYSIVCRCPNPNCNELFICVGEWNNGTLALAKIKPNARVDEKTFSDDIKNISSSFCEIYNQAYATHQMNLMQICGMGYRKALEFLIKDYIISKSSSKKEAIKNKNLAKCIQDDVTDERIKQVAERAVWLGNDETHYVRKWVDKDVDDLVNLIDLTIHWIESEKATERLLEKMPARK